MREYIIEARSFRIGLASHNFWVLKDAGAGDTIGELHGLATNRTTGRIVPIGTTREHGLRAYVFPHDSSYAASVALPVKHTRMFSRSQAHVVYEGADGLARWSAAVNSIPLLNELDLDYPPWGFNLFRPTVNSNSAYRTFGEIMDVRIHEFPGAIGPGLANRMITLQQIDLLRFHPVGVLA